METSIKNEIGLTVEEQAFVDAAKRALEIKEKISFLKKKEKEAMDALEAYAKGDELVTIYGYTFQVFSRVGSVVYADIPELRNIDLNQYRSEPVKMRKISFNKEFDI